MILSREKLKNVDTKHMMLALIGLVVLFGSAIVLFKAQLAKSAVADDSKFRFVMPYFGASSQGTKTYLEIAQVGVGNTLDADGSWSKFYFDANRVNNGTVGVFKGGYGGDVDSLGTVGGIAGQRFNDSNAVKYEFYLAEDTGLTAPNGLTVSEETPCRVDGQLAPSLTVYSGEMSVDGWYKVAADRFVNNAKCGNDRWGRTTKTGKYVLFLRVSWASSAPVTNGQKQGRVNAYKVGAAYANSTQTLDNPITGYWSDFTSSQKPDSPQRASYSVQDRLSNDNTNGSYTFQFAPDCRLSRNDTEVRYLHWRDVDYPEYYQAPWPSQPAPDFKLYEISPSGAKNEVAIDQKYKKFNGSSQNVHGSAPVTFKGGFKYEWVWNNVARVDGISFWIPYDDYSAYAGCGEWSHQLGMKAGPDGKLNTTEFKVAGGQTATINLTQNATGKDAGPATDMDLTVTSTNGKSIASSFSGVSASLKGATSGSSTSTSRVLHWENLSPLGGAYPLIRNDIYAYFKVADNAPDGARYCASAVMSPKSSTDSGGTRSTPNQICFVIDNSLKPFVNTVGGDVHAGDCSITSGALKQIYGNVSQSGSLGSSGTYVVSAGGAIRQFGSGGTPLGSSLTLGKGGLYGDMCRPTFAEMAKEIKNAVPAVPTYDLGQVKAPGTIQFASDGRITGTSKYRVTVYAPNGTVTIAGTTFGGDTANSYSRENLPVVGVLAQNIKIEPSVSTINAILYASLNIDTCVGPDIKTSGGVAACKGKLTLKGFAMAHDFSFKRTTGANGLNESELLQFNAAYYLNPPDGFKKAAGLVKYLGERAPLY